MSEQKLAGDPAEIKNEAQRQMVVETLKIVRDRNQYLENELRVLRAKDDVFNSMIRVMTPESDNRGMSKNPGPLTSSSGYMGIDALIEGLENNLLFAYRKPSTEGTEIPD